MTSPDSSFTPSDLARVSSDLYGNSRSILSLLQAQRYRIAPMGRVIEAIPVGSSVLDVGCGGGLLLNCAAASRRLSYGHGFDSSPHAISVAQAASSRLARLGVNVVPTFEVRSVEQGFPEGSFDVVSVIDVLHHVSPRFQQLAFECAASRVRDGGLLLIKEMRPSPAWRAAGNRLHDLIMARQWIHYVEEPQVDTWAVDCGLRKVASECFDRLWYGHSLSIYSR